MWHLLAGTYVLLIALICWFNDLWCWQVVVNISQWLKLWGKARLAAGVLVHDVVHGCSYTVLYYTAGPFEKLSLTSLFRDWSSLSSSVLLQLHLYSAAQVFWLGVNSGRMIQLCCTVFDPACCLQSASMDLCWTGQLLIMLINELLEVGETCRALREQ